MEPKPSVPKRFGRRARADVVTVVPTPPPPAQGRDDELLRLIEGVHRSPLDAELCYDLAVGLLNKGIINDGLRYLDRAFRLEPLKIVSFVEDPKASAARKMPDVQRLLGRIRRDVEYRTFGGYA